MNVLFVPGIKTYKWYLNGWENDLTKHSAIEAHIVRTDFYMFYQLQVCKKIVEAIKQDIITLQPRIVLAHSFGGILAKTTIAQLPEHSVQLFCTLSSPHAMDYKLIQPCLEHLQTPLELTNVPLLRSYGGLLDPIVLKTHSVLPNAVHTNLPVEHMAFLLSATIRAQILEDCIMQCNSLPI